MKTLGFLVLAALAGATATPTLAEQPPRGARGCEFPAFQWNQNGVDLYQQQQLLLPGPAGRVVFRTSRSYQCRAQDPRTRRTIPGSAFYYRQGLHTVTGQELVPHLYDKVVPYSETAAFVLREDGKWARYRFGAGEEQIPVGAVDFNILWPVIGNVGEFDNGDPCGRPRGERPRRTIAAFSTGEPDAGGHVEVVVYSGDEPPVVLTGLGDPASSTRSTVWTTS